MGAGLGLLKESLTKKPNTAFPENMLEFHCRADGYPFRHKKGRNVFFVKEGGGVPEPVPKSWQLLAGWEILGKWCKHAVSWWKHEPQTETMEPNSAGVEGRGGLEGFTRATARLLSFWYCSVALQGASNLGFVLKQKTEISQLQQHIGGGRL